MCEPRNKRSNGGKTLQWELIDYQVDEVKGKDGRRHGRGGVRRTFCELSRRTWAWRIRGAEISVACTVTANR